MKSLKKKRRIQIIVASFVALAVSTGLIGYAMKDGINFFKSPSEVVESPPAPTETFRLGGMVEEGSIVRGQGEAVKFKITDFANSVQVSYTGILPDLFTEGQGAVTQGKLVDGVFVASEVLAKHDESYLDEGSKAALLKTGAITELPDGTLVYTDSGEPIEHKK